MGKQDKLRNAPGLKVVEQGGQIARSITSYRESVVNSIPSSEIRHIPLGELSLSPENARKVLSEDEELDSLARSIHTNGLLSPIVISPDKIVIAGQRRLAAYQKLRKLYGFQYDTIPAIVYSNTASASVVELSLLENLSRLDLSAEEQYQGISCLIELYQTEGRETVSQPSPYARTPAEAREAAIKDDIASAIGITRRRLNQILKQGREIHTRVVPIRTPVPLIRKTRRSVIIHYASMNLDEQKKVEFEAEIDSLVQKYMKKDGLQAAGTG